MKINEISLLRNDNFSRKKKIGGNDSFETSKIVVSAADGLGNRTKQQHSSVEKFAAFDRIKFKSKFKFKRTKSENNLHSTERNRSRRRYLSGNVAKRNLRRVSKRKFGTCAFFRHVFCFFLIAFRP